MIMLERLTWPPIVLGTTMYFYQYIHFILAALRTEIKLMTDLGA